jgi:hypothetical protein
MQRRLTSGGTVPHGGNASTKVPGCPLTRIITAAHERLIVTYSAQDDTAYVLIPPGEDPRAVPRAARLVLHEEIYRELVAVAGVGCAVLLVALWAAQGQFRGW